MPTVPERVWCSVPTYDADGTTLIGTCGWYLQGDPASREEFAASLGWRLGPEPLCPGHNRNHTTTHQEEETNR